ncbi:hypothetical protein OEG84_25295 [Hoeflea sp. G2-23]|uniref:Uncharacterized protein n=1 Tax=Hoeflea algicola TaxID=2983763 RepID=A0ABT3ZGI1_9HYPH|nr:hypothetical protein [Hoeflea algicola]MCY0150587.1 hypothetical protein [Hoeflea algicola]MCY0150925.1 hypothetical protein [Hoeflea algicola]
MEQIEAAKKALEELANSSMNIPLRDWCRISETILSALSAAEAQEVKPRVKKLVWDRGVVDWARPLPGMKYVACSSDPHPHWSWWLDGLEGPIDHHKCANEQAAKAAAQADYEARIISALIPPDTLDNGES